MALAMCVTAVGVVGGWLVGQVGVKEVGPREIQLSDGSTLPYGLCVWAAGAWIMADEGLAA